MASFFLRGSEGWRESLSSSSLSEHRRSGSARSNANPLTGAVKIPEAVCVCVCVQFHFIFFFNLLITVVYFKAQTVKVDLGTLAEAGERLAGFSRAANAHPEVKQGKGGKRGQLAGPPLSEGSPPPHAVTEAITTEEASRKQPRSLTLKSRTSPAITSERRCACRRLEVQISTPQPCLTASILPSRGSTPRGRRRGRSVRRPPSSTRLRRLNHPDIGDETHPSVRLEGWEAELVSA